MTIVMSIETTKIDTNTSGHVAITSTNVANIEESLSKF